MIDTEIVGARGILLSIAGGQDLTLVEVNEAAETIRAAATDDTNIIFGATIDERLAGQVWVTVVATGIGRKGRRTSAPPLSAGARPSFEPARSTPEPRRGDEADELGPPSFISSRATRRATLSP